MLFPDDPEFLESDAKRELQPIHDELCDAVLYCQDMIKRLSATDPLVAKSFEYLATRQHLMNSLVVERVKELVTEGRLGEVEVVLQRRFLELRFDSIDLRCKKIAPDGSTSNYPTRSNRDYRNQLPLSFDGLPAVTYRARLTLGWLWNVAATEIEDVRIVYAKGDMTLWQYSILKADTEGVIARPIAGTGGRDGAKVGNEEAAEEA